MTTFSARGGGFFQNANLFEMGQSQLGIGVGTGKGHQPPILDIFPELKKNYCTEFLKKAFFRNLRVWTVRNGQEWSKQS